MMPSMRRALQTTVSALLVSLVLAVPRLVLACGVCQTGRDDETQIAFRISTGAMTLMPFLLVGGLFWWLRKRFLAVAEEQARTAAASTAQRPAVSPSLRG